MAKNYRMNPIASSLEISTKSKTTHIQEEILILSFLNEYSCFSGLELSKKGYIINNNSGMTSQNFHCILIGKINFNQVWINNLIKRLLYKCLCISYFYNYQKNSVNLELTKR